MTKKELVIKFQEACDLTGAVASDALNKLGDIMAAELLGGGEVPLEGIGKLKVKETSARVGRNPQTGESINIPAGRKVTLVVGKELKEALK